MKITNISSGPKSIWSAPLKQMVMIQPGETVEADIDDREAKSAPPSWFKFEDQPLTTSPVVDHETPSGDPQTEDNAEPAPRPRGRPRKAD